MSSHRTEEVLYETEAALRLVDHGLLGLRDATSQSDQIATTTRDTAINIVDARMTLDHDDCVGSVGR